MYGKTRSTASHNVYLAGCSVSCDDVYVYPVFRLSCAVVLNVSHVPGSGEGGDPQSVRGGRLHQQPHGRLGQLLARRALGLQVLLQPHQGTVTASFAQPGLLSTSPAHQTDKTIVLGLNSLPKVPPSECINQPHEIMILMMMSCRGL